MTNNQPHTQKRKPAYRAQAIIRGLMLLCLIGMLAAGVILIRNNKEYSQGNAAYDQVRSAYKSTSEDGEIFEEGDPYAALPNLPPIIPGSIMDFSPLIEINADTVGWLIAEDTAIDYPLVQASDNVYYLTHLFNKDTNKLGSLFMDYRNQRDFTDRTTIIYGHNMLDNSMFASLTDYEQQEYFENHPVMRLYTPQGDYSVKLFAGFVESGNSEFIRLTFKDDADFLAYIKQLKSKSTFDSIVEVQAQDRIIALSTCSYNFNNARYVLFGKLVPIIRRQSN
ncbi:MAG: class B sortase [Anaerolineaceae bacterium]|nr:class B sortase [Anaerolineaceae bacterium]